MAQFKKTPSNRTFLFEAPRNIYLYLQNEVVLLYKHYWTKVLCKNNMNMANGPILELNNYCQNILNCQDSVPDLKAVGGTFWMVALEDVEVLFRSI